MVWSSVKNRKFHSKIGTTIIHKLPSVCLVVVAVVFFNINFIEILKFDYDELVLERRGIGYEEQV